jgi:hypothetical protein
MSRSAISKKEPDEDGDFAEDEQVDHPLIGCEVSNRLWQHGAARTGNG